MIDPNRPRLRLGPPKNWVPAPSWLDLLELIYALRFPDREILEALVVRDGFTTHALKAALGDMVRRELLDNSLRLAHTTRAEMGQARKRVCYFVGPKAKEFIQVDPYVWNAKLGRVRGLRKHHENLAHERGVTWIHALLIAGERQGLWNLESVARGHNTSVVHQDGKRHTPDLLTTLSTFQDYEIAWEFERTNRYTLDDDHRSPVKHAEFYWQAYQEGTFNGRVVFVTEAFRKMVNLRRAVTEHFGAEVGNFFRFMSYETCDIATVERLLSPDALLTSSDSPTWLVQPKRDTLTEPGLASR